MIRPKFMFILAATLLLGFFTEESRAVGPTPFPSPNATEANVVINSFAFNSSVLLQMYNFASNNATTDGSGNTVFKLDNFPTNLVPGALNVVLTNKNSQPFSPSIQISIYDPTYDNSNPVAWGCSVSTKQPIPANSQVTLNALDFQPINFSGNFVQTYVDSQLNPIKDDPSKIKPLLTRQFRVCAKIVTAAGNCSATYYSGSSSFACTTFSIFTGQPSTNCVSAAPLQPLNRAVPSGLPRFSWTPATKTNGMGSGASYTLNIMEDTPDSAPKQSVQVTGGQTSYQWTSADYALQAGKKYYWQVVSLDQYGQPFCGANGQGGSQVCWFTFGGVKCGPFSALDADKIAQDKALGPDAANSDVGKKLQGMRPANYYLSDGTPADDLLCRLRDGRAKVVSHELVTQ